VAVAFAIERRQRVEPREGGRPRACRYSSGEILDAIRRWASLYGAPPTLTDWEPSRARRKGQDWRAERWEEGSWPSARMVRRQFGTLGAAVAAAGFDRPPQAGTKGRLTGPEQVLAAIREWTRRYGEPPTQADWDTARARMLGQEWRVARYRDGDWPSTQTVRQHYGSLSAAVRAAGLQPRDRTVSPGESAQRRAANRAALAERSASEHDETEVGPDVLARALREVATARANYDDAGVEAALVELAACALSWAGALRGEPVPAPRGDAEVLPAPSAKAVQAAAAAAGKTRTTLRAVRA
jgi:hypothetical protein